MIKNSIWRLALISLLLLVGLAACSRAGESTAVVSADIPLPESAASASPSPAATLAEASPTPVGALQTSAYPAPVEAPASVAGGPTAYPAPGQPTAVVPTAGPPETAVTATAVKVTVIKQELEASDPETVQLASGKLQLVEFFAFW